MKRCPKCGGTTFYTVAHVMQEWKVDANANFIEASEDCLETTHEPCDDNYWACAKCKYEARGHEFNVDD